MLKRLSEVHGALFKCRLYFFFFHELQTRLVVLSIGRCAAVTNFFSYLFTNDISLFYLLQTRFGVAASIANTLMCSLLKPSSNITVNVINF